MGKSAPKHDARAVVREYIKRFGDPEALQEDKGTAKDRSYRWQEDLFEQQMAFINDPASFKTALCSRRAGKTYAACYYLIETASRNPDSICAYIALTRNSAKRLMWMELKRANRKYHIGMHFNNSELIATLPNRSQLVLTGANDEADIDKLRGSAYHLVILDEAASFGRHLEELVEEVLEPALIDHNGTMAMIGTPNAACSGMFHRASTDKTQGYSNHHWTILENPHIPHAEQWLERRMKQKHWDKTHPVYLREWRGKWIRSNDSLIYKYTEEKNFYKEIPHHEHDFDFILGIDLGYEDATAFVIGAYCPELPDFYIVECYKETKMIPAQIAEKIKELDSQYDFNIMVADTGGLGKSIVEEFRFRYELPVRAAEKRNKASYIELMNSDLHCGFVKVFEGCEILDEWDLLQWDEDRKKEDSRFENHLADACLYAWRESKHYTYKQKAIAPKQGSPEYYDALENEIWEKQAQAIDNKDGEAWWEHEWTLN